jgi:hypothetical protein
MHKILLMFALLAPAAHADTFTLIDAKPRSELWLNGGFFSHHFQQTAGFNNRNLGFGGEYRYSTVSSITAGEFYNSDRRTSHYVGWYWQPVQIGVVRAGLVAGGFDGYPMMQNGGWFVAAIPMLSVEYQRIGANLAIVPSYQNRLHGALSLQLKVKLF